MKGIEIRPNTLEGRIRIPPSKSISHRAIICAGLCEGRSRIENVLLSQDILATCAAMEALGAEIYFEKERFGPLATLYIRGNPHPKAAKPTIDCRESGSTLRFLIPLAAFTGEEMTLIGRKGLAGRPLHPYYEIFEQQKIFYAHHGGELPLRIQGKLHPGTYELAGDISSQFISGLLFLLPLLKGDSTIHVTTDLASASYVDLTLDLLKAFSIEVRHKEYRTFFIPGHQRYRARDYAIEGDYSQGAFWMVAGLLSEGEGISCTNLNLSTLQGDGSILEILRKMSGNIGWEDPGLTARASRTNGRTLDLSQCPDLMPILAVLAGLSRGQTRMVKAGRLRFKESDRLKAMARELNRIGGSVNQTDDGLIIEGVEHFQGGRVDSWNDHRIAMALAIASIKCTQPMTIINSDVVDKSYPGFWEDFVDLGGIIHERNLG